MKVYTLNNINGREISLIESTFNVKFPEGTNIVHASVEDYANWVRFKAIIPSDAKESFTKSLQKNYESYPSYSDDLSDFYLPWWKTSFRNIDVEMRDDNNFRYIFICKPKEGNLEIFLSADEERKAFPKELKDSFYSSGIDWVLTIRPILIRNLLFLLILVLYLAYVFYKKSNKKEKAKID